MAVIEAEDALIKLSSIEETVGVLSNTTVRANLKALGTELVKLFEQEELI